MASKDEQGFAKPQRPGQVEASLRAFCPGKHLLVSRAPAEFWTDLWGWTGVGEDKMCILSPTEKGP